MIIQRQQQQIIRDIQLEEEDEQRRRDARRQPPGTLKRERIGGQPASESKRCIEVATIEFLDADHLSDRQKDDLAAPYLGKCINLGQIQDIIRDATNLYIDEGYVTSRVLVPPQDLSDGSLELQVVEGYAEAIVPGDPESRINLQTAFPGIVGNILNIRDIEQGLDQLNRLPSNDATMRLLPGEEPGETTIVVNNDGAFFVSGSGSVNNYGSRSTGETSGSGTIFIDNPLGLNDQVILGLGRNLEEPSPDALSRNYTVSYSVPYGYWTVEGGFSSFEYVSALRGQTDTFDTNGHGNTANISLSKVVRRDQVSKTTLTGTLTRKENENFIEGSQLVTSSRTTTFFDLGVVHVLYASGATVTLDAGIAQGVPIFGAENNVAFDGAPDEDFTLIHSGASLAKGWAAGRYFVSVTSSLTGQYSANRLPGTEQISIGGAQTVRGFRDQPISGNSGFYARNEIYLALPQTDHKVLNTAFGSVRPYVGIDVGYILAQENSGVFDGGTMVGGAAGIRAVGGKLTFDLAVGVPLLDPSDTLSVSDTPDFYFSAGTNF